MRLQPFESIDRDKKVSPPEGARGRISEEGGGSLDKTIVLLLRSSSIREGKDETRAQFLFGL